jgi:hypothetical protein
MTILLSSTPLIGCNKAACENEVLQGKPSPDGALIAFVYFRRCGSSQETTTHVAVISFHDSLRNEPGNVLAVGRAQPVKILWRGPKELEVGGFTDPTYQRTAPIDSVAIKYP